MAVGTQKRAGTREAAVISARAPASGEPCTGPAGRAFVSCLVRSRLTAGERRLWSSDDKRQMTLNNYRFQGDRGGSTPSRCGIRNDAYRDTGAAFFAFASRSSTSATRRVIFRIASGSTEIESIPCSTGSRRIPRRRSAPDHHRLPRSCLPGHAPGGRRDLLRVAQIVVLHGL